LLQISHTNLFVANKDFGDNATTSASGSEKEEIKLSLLKKLAEKNKSFEIWGSW
jgi:hypothetical protein